MNCFECDSADEIQMHHIVPRSLGGTKTVPLCSTCHGKAHQSNMSKNSLTRAALGAIRASGRKTGGDVPYGFELLGDGRTLAPCAAERAVIERARELRAAGLSLRAVAGELARAGMLNRAGRPFHPPALATFCKEAA
jgi:hypothetical protein